MKFHPKHTMADFFRQYGFRTAAEDPSILTLTPKLIAQEWQERVDAIAEIDAAQPGSDVWIAAMGHYGQETADLIWVLCKDAYARGLDMADFLDAITESNSRKVGPDGKIEYDEDGKVRKPKGWRKPDFAAIAARQIAANDSVL